MTVLVTAILIGALLVLFPSPAGAVFANMGASDIQQMDANGNVRVAFDLEIPDGEHFPVDEIEVRAIAGAVTLSGGRIIPNGGTWACSGPISTADAANPRVVLISIAGGEAEQGPFGAQGYTNVGYDPNTGYYSHGGHSNLGGLGSYDNGYGAGTGLGYGYGSSGLNLRIVVELRGCTFFSGAGDDFDRAFTFQAIVGAAGLSSTASTITLPIVKTLINPDAPVLVDAVSDTITSEFTTSTSGDTTSSTVSLSGANPGESLTAALLTDFQELNPGNPSLGLPGVTSVTASFRDMPDFGSGPQATIPPGTEIGVSHQTGASASLGAPAFGISGVSLATATSSDPLTYFRVTASAPGFGDFDPAGLLDALDIRMCFAAAGVPNPNAVQMRGFNDEGGPKDTHPSVHTIRFEENGAGVADDQYCFTFRISNFSAFAVISAFVGGGGGGAPTTTPTQTPLVDVDNDGLPDSWELDYFGSPTGADPTGDADDDGLTNIEEYDAGTDPTKADTDGDGISDADEIVDGTDPLDENDPGSDDPTPPGSDDTGTPSDDDPGDRSRIPGPGIVVILAGLAAAGLLVRRRL